MPAEQHDAEEAGFEEERGEHFVGQQRAGDAAGEGGELAPVGAELVGHHQAGDHAHAEVDREDLRPEVVEVAVDLLVGLQPQPFEHGQVAGQADGDGGEDDVEGHGKGELDPSQVERLQSGHDDSSQVDACRAGGSGSLPRARARDVLA
ncbi:hypothetical protein D9M71_359800 [compost metagenome]